MNRTQLKRLALISGILLLLVVGACGLWLYTQQRQYAFNRQLIAALVHGDDKQALALVSEGADPNTHYKPTPVPSLRQLCDQLLHRSPPPDNDSPTAFLIVCGADSDTENDADALDKVQPYRSNDARLVQAMLKHGANVNAKDKDGWTALMVAIAANRRKTVGMLLKYGAGVNAKDMLGRTPLKVAVDYEASPDIMRLLLEHKADVDAMDKYRDTPLTSAVMYDASLDVVRLLLEHGANANAKHDGGQTSLMLAGQSPDIVRLLLEHGADVNAKDNRGRTPLIFAIEPPTDPDVLRLLLQHRAEVNAKDNSGMTPLMLAAKYDAPDEVIHLLLEHKANINAKDEHGITPLMYAEGHPDIISLLKQARARK